MVAHCIVDLADLADTASIQKAPGCVKSPEVGLVAGPASRAPQELGQAA